MSVLSSMFNWLRPPPPIEPDVRTALARVALWVDKTLAVEPGFERKLAPSVRKAVDYCAQLVAELPPPLEVERAKFAAEPHVHALFASADDIDAMLGHSLAVREYIDSHDGVGSDYCYALLAARRMEKSVLGVESEGAVLQHDVPQRLLHFSNHTLSLLADAPDLARRKLHEASFDSLVKTFAAHVSALRSEQNALRQEKALTAARDRIAHRHHNSGLGETPYARTIASLNERLRSNAEALLPQHQIAALADFLANPEDALRLETIVLHVARNGRIINTPTAEHEADTLQFSELIARDRRRYVVMPVCFPRTMVLQAQEHAREELARFIVI